jgi:hypothetical protein
MGRKKRSREVEEAEKADADRLEDQADWERCHSFQRMFLALHDEGANMDRPAKEVVDLVVKHRPASPYTEQAYDAYYNGLADEAQARPVFMVFTMAARAIDDEGTPPPPPGGGAAVVCMLIRKEVPLAPDGFRRVGKLEGRPNEQAPSARVLPSRLHILLSPEKDLLV